MSVFDEIASSLRYAITLWRPWDTLMVKGYKPIENRSWRPSPKTLKKGDWFAYHAGIGIDSKADALAKKIGVPKTAYQDLSPPFSFVGVGLYDGWVSHSDNPWFFGPYGWKIPYSFALSKPIEHKGKMGLWLIPETTRKQILKSIVLE